ncbi:MAG: 50S ribosomal protein L18 [Chloroflexi bacterium]|nr:50S ribosomal protein L18 [Chloroflexota bacterium]MCI0855377.1 50S ribosomal protein L18 [Chloroflexota bacterium]MCI0889937.1 50S ribosomal protein L18 [Chloroflexota bacterium]
MKRSKTAQAARLRRHLRVRKRVYGTGEKPRLCVYRSLTHIYAQVIDDDRGHTIAAASDVDADARGEVKGKRKSDVAKVVGELIGKRAKEQGVSTVVFDRGGYQFHGRVKALATGAREAGLKF